MNENEYRNYCRILEEELIPAMGCTEPIALAYAGALARNALGRLPDHVNVEASGSIIKNVKSVIVPHTNHRKGIQAAVAAGIVAGDCKKELEVISDVSAEQIQELNRFLDETPIEVKHLGKGCIFDIIVTVYADDSYAKVRIVNYHTNVVKIEKDGVVLKSIPFSEDTENALTGRDSLTLEKIYEFAETVAIEDVKEVLDRQITFNMAIAEEGLRNEYGANIGKVLLQADGDSLKVRAKAYACAGSDARMNGCELPVVINSGSGNQGITASVPVIVYARALGQSEEALYRALVISNLTAIHQKTKIGRLSAYCGAVNAAAGAAAGIAYLRTHDYSTIIHTVVNALAIVSGIICDGAKASCAGKIAMALDAGFLGYEMYMQGQEFVSGDGIVAEGVEASIANVGILAKEGMKETNEEIIRLMMKTR